MIFILQNNEARLKRLNFKFVDEYVLMNSENNILKYTTEVPDPDGFFGTSYKDVTISIYFNRKTEKVVLITDNCGLFNRIKFEKDFKDIIRDIKLSIIND